MGATTSTGSNGNPLDSLFRARSVALVGATDRSVWSQAAFANFGRLDFPGRVHVVNRKGGTVHGVPAATSCAAIDETVDAALLMVPEQAIGKAFADLNAAGIRNAVLLTSGFAEVGAEGARRQEELVASARSKGVTLLGPNCLGFINYTGRVPIWTTRPPMPIIPDGAIGIVSQSGATAGFIAGFAHRQGIGLSYQISTGNEADVNVARVVDFLVDDPATRVIGLFLETVHDATLLAAAARRALAADKPVIAMKIGSSEAAARAAEAHTGSLVGDDRVFDAVCRQFAIIRVSSIEDLVFTAGLLAQVGHVRDRRLGLVSISGGVCEMAADHAEAAGVAVPPLTEKTKAALREVLPDFGTPNNPLDVTGGAMLDPSLFARSLPALGADPSIGLVACFMSMPDTAEELASFHGEIVRQIGAGFRASDQPAVMLSISVESVTEPGRVLLNEAGITHLGSGVQHGLAAIGRAFAWAERQERGIPPAPAQPAPATERPTSEHATLAYLASCGVPVVPLALARNAAEAVAAVQVLGGPAVLKVASPDVAHKSDIGGVLLNLEGAVAVAEGFDRIMASVRAAKPEAAIDGVLVAPMRAGSAVELFVGVLRDPLWGSGHRGRPWRHLGGGAPRHCYSPAAGHAGRSTGDVRRTPRREAARRLSRSPRHRPAGCGRGSGAHRRCGVGARS